MWVYQTIAYTKELYPTAALLQSLPDVAYPVMRCVHMAPHCRRGSGLPDWNAAILLHFGR